MNRCRGRTWARAGCSRHASPAFFELMFCRIEVDGSWLCSIVVFVSDQEPFAIAAVSSKGLERTPHLQTVLETSRGTISVVGIDSILEALREAS